jgi:hypothetical protein
MIRSSLMREQVRNLLQQQCVPPLTSLGPHSQAPGGPPSPGVSSPRFDPIRARLIELDVLAEADFARAMHELHPGERIG